MILENKLRNANARWYPKHLFYTPKRLVLGVNNVCNLHCKMCDVGTQNLDSNFAVNLVGTKPLNMPMELLLQTLDNIADYCPKAEVAYAFTEPLVYPHLLTSLIYANQKNLYTSLTTNALTLPQKAEALVQAGLNQINISLDGLAEIHNEIRGNKRSFQKAIEGIKRLNTFKNRPIINIIFAITEWNQHQLYDFACYFKSLGIDSIGFMHTQFTTPEMAVEHNVIWNKTYPATDSNVDIVDMKNIDIKVLKQQIDSVKKDTFPFKVYFQPDIGTEALLETYYKYPSIFMGKRCHDIYNNVMIKSNGDVIPAHGRCYNLTIGNLYKQDLKTIWNSEIIKNFRVTVDKAGGLLPACSRCCSGFGK